MKIILAETEKEIHDCYIVMAELRPHLKQDEYFSNIKKLKECEKYKLAFAWENEVKAVSGFRILESLAWNKYLYVDDLVTKETDRYKGYGGKLFDWLFDYAKKEKCSQLHLDSRVTRFGAHRFYMNKKMVIEAYHFSMGLE